MDDMLKNTPKILNETVLKDVHFHERNKENVRQMIRKKHKKPYKIKSIFNHLFPLAAISLFCLGVSYFIVTGMTDHPVANGGLPQEPPMETKLYLPPRQEEFYGDMTKEDVVSKLLNSIDYFHSAAGKFNEYKIFQDGSTRAFGATYKISTKNEIGGYEKLVTLDEKTKKIKNEIQEYYYNNKKSWLKYRELDGQKFYTVSDIKHKPKRDIVTPDEVFSIDLNYLSNYDLREMPPIVISSISLFPYREAASYLRKMEHWKIEKQNEELLGHNTLVLSGTIDEELKQNVNLKESTDTFRFWVDKDTGILVKSETYDKNGELTSYIHPESLSVNVPIDPQEFIPDLRGYQLPNNQKKD